MNEWRATCDDCYWYRPFFQEERDEGGQCHHTAPWRMVCDTDWACHNFRAFDDRKVLRPDECPGCAAAKALLEQVHKKLTTGQFASVRCDVPVMIERLLTGGEP